VYDARVARTAAQLENTFLQQHDTHLRCATCLAAQMCDVVKIPIKYAFFRIASV
jgi:hypothetical protein